MLFTGRLTANAEVKTVKGDKSVTNFTVALNQRYKTKTGEKKEKSVFVDCAYWINPKLAAYLTKGAIVEISGWVEAQAYQNSKEELRGRLNCTVNDINLFSTPANSTATTADSKPKSTGAGKDDDDLPF
jgi:single-strand DNA-binding protein